MAAMNEVFDRTVRLDFAFASISDILHEFCTFIALGVLRGGLSMMGLCDAKGMR
jgi:hypothetical protein